MYISNFSDCRVAFVANGEVQYTFGTKYNDIVSVSCHSGYVINGTGTLVCLESGLWSTETKCIKIGNQIISFSK